MSRRIAVVSFLLEWPSRGGGIIHTLELCQFLQQGGYEVRLFHPRFPQWGIGNVSADCPFPPQTIEFTPSEWHLPGIQQKFRQAVSEFNPAAVLVTDSWNIKPCLAAVFPDQRVFLRMQAQECLCPLNNLRLVPDQETILRPCPYHQLATPHACQSCLAQNGHTSGQLHQLDRRLSEVQSPGYQRLLQNVLHSAEAVLVVNPLHAEALRPWCQRVEVVPYGMDPQRFPEPTPRTPEGPARLLFAGVMQDVIKGYQVLRQAGDQLWQQRQDFEIWITEDPPEPSPEDRRFERFIGWQSQTDLVDRYRETDVVVVPTIAPDGLSRTSVEAMGCGRPVVASDIGGLPYSVADGLTGLLFTPHDPLDLAEKLNRLLDDVELRARLGQAGRQVFADRFTWPQIIQSHYLPLLGPSPRHPIATDHTNRATQPGTMNSSTVSQSQGVSGMGINEIIHLLVNVGFAAALVVYFVWQSTGRENKTQATIDQMTQFQRETLMELVTQNTQAFQQNIQVVEEFRNDLKELRIQIKELTERISFHDRTSPGGG